MIFNATKARVFNRGIPPDSFLETVVTWGKSAPPEIFAPNAEAHDVMNILAPVLGPWSSPQHRRAALLECMRVHAGYESGWNWNEGVDTTNAHSVAHPEGAEAGVFQVSFDSTYLDHAALKPFALAHDIGTPAKFIPAMKSNHTLALEYYARLVRVNYLWAGPLIRPEDVRAHLSRAAVSEFQTLLAA